jgi:phage N-6-adenine-methyltransferase
MSMKRVQVSSRAGELDPGTRIVDDPKVTSRRECRRLMPLFGSKSDEWPTPQYLFDALNSEFGFTLDACATSANAKCAKFFTKAEDGLAQDWSGETLFMNPPYGRNIGRWVEKAYLTSCQGSTVVCLLPARTDTRWWHRFVMKGEIRFLRGRLRFQGGKHAAPFPSAIVVFRPSRIRIASMPANSSGRKAGSGMQEPNQPELSFVSRRKGVG